MVAQIYVSDAYLYLRHLFTILTRIRKKVDRAEATRRSYTLAIRKPMATVGGLLAHMSTVL
jgi:hypothetical protein